MSKKSVKKTKEKPKKERKNPDTNKILINNFVQLQKVITNLAIKFENLSDNITKLLQLFELSARSFAEKQDFGTGIEKDKEFLGKLNTLMDQNKTIARGLTLMEEKLRHRVYGSEPERENIPQQRPRPRLPRF